ncbi:RE1, partial [Symbiodinium necroappetens]
VEEERLGLMATVAQQAMGKRIPWVCWQRGYSSFSNFIYDEMDRNPRCELGAFLEWIYETGQVVGSITDKASSWWTSTLDSVMEAYHRYQMETPLKRLEVRPGPTPGVDVERWARLDKRVLALLMPAMTATIKQEVLMLRLETTKEVLFKLYTVYAPGGAAERASLLRQLETIPTTTSVIDLIANMRRWKKLASRAAEMGVALPDGSVLLMAIEAAVKGVVDVNRDMAFKLNMAKQELQLPYQPTLSAVMVYADHVMAELHQIIPYTNKDAKLKGLSTTPSSPTSSAASPKGKGNGQPQPCKFWLSDDGCRRGASCKFSHQFATKEDKKARCWTCGSKNHRQGECPTKQNNGKKGPKGGGSQGDAAATTSSTAAPQVASMATSGTTTTMMAPPVPTMISGETASTSASSTLEHPMASGQTTSSSEPSSTASTILFNENANTGEIRELAEQFLAKIKRLAPMQAQTDGAVMDLELLLRRVKVQLADGKTVSLRQNTGGTLLAEDDQGGTILPLGSLVSSLGCELEWSRKRGLQVRHPKHGLLPTKLVGNTPVLREAEALQLIADLEDIELNKLHGSTVEGAIKMLSADEYPSTWLDHLEEYVNKGERKCLRRMLLDEESPLQAFTEEDIAALIGHDEKILLSDEAGAHYLKALPYNRAHRKRLLATRWIVHMYNGDESGHELAKAESDDVTVIRMDIRDSKAFDLKNYGPAARALMWAAARGQIEGVIGAPPRGPQHDSLLFRRMMMVWLVANSGAVLNGLCAPFFNMEAPTYHPVWTSMSWFRFKDELRFLKYHSLGVQGHMYFMASSLELSDGMNIEEAHIRDLNYEKPPSSWPSALKYGLAQAMVNWRRSALRWAEPSLCAMVGNRNLNAKDLAYWQNHINNNHVPYDKRCRTCVRGSATGRAHRRCLTPSAYTLSMDICGPMRTRGESPDGKKFRYLLVGAYAHPKLELLKDKSLPPVEEEDEIEAELDPLEEDEKVPQPDEEEDEEQKAMNERCKEIYKGIGDDIECQTLHFVVPVVTRTSKQVRAKIQQIYLQLRQHGLPLVRIHSDRGLELKAKETRAWMADRDILATTGESQQPQQNGRAEALVREIKRRVKVRQRDLALGNYEDEDLPYGTFVGYSHDVKNGRVVRHDDGSYTTSVHIKPYLFDPGEIADLGPHELELPVPERRVRGKATISQLLQEPDNDIDSFAKDYINNEKFALEDVVNFWEVLKDKAGSTTRAAQGEGLQWMVGQYTYGGKCGVMRNTSLYPIATSYLVEAFKRLTGRTDFTALLLTENVGMKCHRDVHNHGQRNNLLLPLLQCDEGGGVWVESPSSEYDLTDEWKETPKGGWRRGRVRELRPGHLIYINPRMYHATEPWEGRRLVVTAYTPRTSKMTQPTYDLLRDYGFEPPPLQPHVPDELKKVFLRMMALDETTEPEAVMFLVNEAEEEKRSKTKAISQELQQLQEDVLERLRERREWLKEFLAEEEILAEEFQNVGEAIHDEIKGINDVVRDLISDVEEQIKAAEKKCNQLFIKVANVDDDKEIGDIEEYLSNLKKDLEVTLDVPLDQVKANLDQWVAPMKAELANLEEKTDAIERWPISEARRLEQEGKLILIPGKVVCTVKPPPPLSSSPAKNQLPRWKRKARVVICGNMAGQWHDPNDLFAAGASVEGLRLALAIAVAMSWCIASTDVSAAFLQARWPADRPTYGVIPPKILLQAGLVEPGVVFIVKRALYGLRESPALWAAHRTETLRGLSVESPEGRVYLKQMITDGELWMILVEPKGGGRPILRGILVTCVDDLLYMGQRELIVQVHEKISSIWPCSALEFADEGLRYLGMELVQEEAYVTLSQESYVDNLVRLHGLDPQSSAGLPCPKEWLQDEDFDDSIENFNDDELRRAQRVTGECLWLAYRTRPDILFVTNYMAAMTSKKPVKVYHVGLKVIAYLNSTAALKLKIAVLEGVKLGCLLLVMLAIQSLAAAAEAPPEEQPVKLKDPLPMTGTSELLLLVVMTCIAAVAVWELMKWAYAMFVPMIFGTKKSRRLKKLRELARAAAEAEIERWIDDGAQHQNEDILQNVRRTLRATSSDPGPAATQDRLPEAPLEAERTPSPRGRSPVASRTSVFGGTRPPTPPIPRSLDEGLLERGRVVHDVLALMTTQHLREALVHEGLPVTGLKEDLINRLTPKLGTADYFPATLPSTRQLRYLLYIWRHRGLSGRTQIRWATVSSRTSISAWIANWKEA